MFLATDPLLLRIDLESEFVRNLHRFEPSVGFDPSADFGQPNAIPLLCTSSFVCACFRFV